MCTPLCKNQLLIGSDYAPALISLIDEAKKSVRAVMFDWRFYRTDFSCDVSLINHSIIRAKRRGVDVRLVVNSGEIVETFENLGISIRKYNGDKLLHSKVFVIDDETVLLGSHNITENAMHRNIETSLVIKDAEIAKKLCALFDSLK